MFVVTEMDMIKIIVQCFKIKSKIKQFQRSLTRMYRIHPKSWWLFSPSIHGNQLQSLVTLMACGGWRQWQCFCCEWNSTDYWPRMPKITVSHWPVLGCVFFFVLYSYTSRLHLLEKLIIHVKINSWVKIKRVKEFTVATIVKFQIIETIFNCLQWQKQIQHTSDIGS